MITRRNMPIRAGFSEDGAYVVCGSDGGAVFVWDAAPADRWELLRVQNDVLPKYTMCMNTNFVWFHNLAHTKLAA